jgi:hypothetical protein
MARERVAVGVDRLETMARLLGSQNCTFCPPEDDKSCWLKRTDLAPRLTGDPVANECAECWLSFVHRDA